MTEFALFATPPVRDALLAETSRSVLVGGEHGYCNFGDILQLQGAIATSTSVGCRPLVLLSLESLRSAAEAQNAAERYGGDCDVAFFSSGRISPADEEALCAVEAIRGVMFIHMYGGGFLNELWGRSQISLVELLIDGCEGTPPYIISGQQVETRFAPAVAEHCRRHPPLLCGARDPQSVEALLAAGIEAGYSFDDASERVFQLAAEGHLESGPGLALHLNLSGYTGSQPEVRALTHQLSELQQARPCGTATLLSAFDDSRHFVVDSLGSVKELEERFPFAEYRVVHLPRVALGHASLSLRADLGFTCSYHVAMLCQELGLPVWLVGNNEYYTQKRLGLGIGQRFEEFIASPSRVRLSERREARAAWTARVGAALAEVVSAGRKQEIRLQRVAGRAPVRFKTNEVASVRAVEWYRQRADELWDALSDLQARAQLQNEQSVRQGAQIGELEASLCTATARLQELEGLRVQLDAEFERSRELEIMLADARARISLLVVQLKKRADVESELRQYIADLEKAQSDAQHVRSNAERMEADVAASHRQLEELRVYVKDLERVRDDWDRLSESFKQVSAERSEAMRRLDAAASRSDELQEALAAARVEQEQLHAELALAHRKLTSRWQALATVVRGYRK